MRPLGVIVLIVLVDLLGFTIVMPLLGPFAAHYQFSDWQIGLLFSAYPVCQLVAGPILGRLSDRYGRRPLLIFSQAGTALSFLILGLSRDFTVMLLARLLDGASGGNILVAQAYVADVTAPEDRARGMGLIGMAFGLGFVLGPLLGGVLLSLPLADDWRLRLPFLVAAGFSTLAWVLVLARLPESLPRGNLAREAARVASWRGIVDTISVPGIGRLILIGFLAVLAFAAFEGTFALFLLRRMQWDARTAAFAFAGIGFLSAVVQGGLIRRLGSSVWRSETHRDRARAGRLRIRRHGTGQERHRTGWFHDASWRRARTAQSISLGVTLPDHAHDPAGGRFRNAHLGTNSRSDDQLLGIECLARQRLDRRALLGSVRGRRGRHRRGKSCGRPPGCRETPWGQRYRRENHGAGRHRSRSLAL